MLASTQAFEASALASTQASETSVPANALACVIASGLFISDVLPSGTLVKDLLLCSAKQ